MIAISKILQKYFFLLIALAVVLGFQEWYWALKSVNLIKPMLAFVIFAMGLTLHFEDFKKVFVKPWTLILGVAAQYLIMPLLAFLIALAFQLPAELALGLLLVGVAPGGVVSNVMVYICGANLPLSVSMTFFSTLLAPVFLPSLMWLYAQHWVDVNAQSLFESVVSVVLVPLLLGLIITSLFEKFKIMREANQKEELGALVSTLSIIAVALIILIIVSASAAKILEILSLAILIKISLAVILHNALGMYLGYNLPKLFADKLGLDKKEFQSIAIEVGIQNSGLASVLGLVYFGPLTVIPTVFSASWHAFSGSVMANFWIRNK